MLAFQPRKIISGVKDNVSDNFFCPIAIRLGVQTIPAASLLIGEVGLSHFLHTGIILPSPIGIELMEYPAKMGYILNRKTLAKDQDYSQRVLLRIR